MPAIGKARPGQSQQPEIQSIPGGWQGTCTGDIITYFQGDH